MFADIIVDIKHEKLDRIFQYRIPEWLKEELNVGMEVVIPFGKGNRQTKGYVVGISETCDYDLSKVKEIEDISRNSVEIEAKLIALAAWMKEHYGGTMIQALKTVFQAKRECQDQKVCPSAAWQRTGRSAAALLSAEESEGESKTSGSTSGGSGH